MIQVLNDNLLVQGCRSDGFDDDLPVDLQHLPAFLDQGLIGVVDMPFVGQFMKDVKDTRGGPQVRILGKTELPGNLVGRDEADAVDIRGKAVGVLLDNLNGLLAVLLEDLGGIAGADTMGLEEDHDGPDLLLLLPCLSDHADALLANPLDIDKAVNLVLNDIQGLLPKHFNDPFRHDRTNALDQPGAEVLLHTVNGGRSRGLT
ncbi:MAG: hypothetical protein A4E68_02212 [Syntrophaceae bacterium PtaB.Bin095]|nr:MAG: hypothetical protein A4E68_02212 [Syntrophaceae bacterium PtaB.Bin095]